MIQRVTEQMVEADIEQIRQAMNRLRAKASLGAEMWTDPVIRETNIVMDIIQRKALSAAPASASVAVKPTPPPNWTFQLGDMVRKKSGSWWEGEVVGFYSTEQTPVGYCVQLTGWTNGPVQIYPESALEFLTTQPDTRERSV